MMMTDLSDERTANRSTRETDPLESMPPVTLPADVPPQKNRARSPTSSSSEATPTQHDQSPLAARVALTPKQPSSLSRRSTATTATPSSSSSSYDLTTRRNLIARAAADGDLARLDALVVRGANDSLDNAGEQQHRSVFTLANEPNPHTGLAPIHFAAQNGHEDVVKWLVEQAGALPDLEDADGEVGPRFLVCWEFGGTDVNRPH